MEPRIDFSIRTATPYDFGWIDAMQKAETDKLGFLMKAAIEKRIEQGNVLIAAPGITPGSAPGDTPGRTEDEVGTPGLGYCIAVDRYMKQDHVGQFVQLNVTPGSRRGLVGAALVKATFERAAYGVKLYGLWCRQDLAANHFWRSLGFVPLAFRAAGVSNRENKKKRADPRKQVHIYWQRRVRDGDSETPYWFPYETSGGMMAESRLVLPIPPGTSWEDAKPVVLPGAERRAAEDRLLEVERGEKAEADKTALAAKRKEARAAAKEAQRLAEGPATVHGLEIGSGAAGVPTGFALPPEVLAAQEAERKAAEAAAEKQRIKDERREAKRSAKRARRKTDPELLAYSRELRDRWQEAVAAEPGLLLTACGDGGAARYDVGRLIAPTSTSAPGILGTAATPGVPSGSRLIDVEQRDAA
ncbi:MAG: hypothetical protein AAF800_10780 [Planctomycetota bacterium]